MLADQGRSTRPMVSISVHSVSDSAIIDQTAILVPIYRCQELFRSLCFLCICAYATNENAIIIEAFVTAATEISVLLLTSRAVVNAAVVSRDAAEWMGAEVA